MKNLIQFSFLLLLFSSTSFAQTQFQKRYTHYPPTGISTIGIIEDGSAILVNDNTTQGNFNFTKIDSSGNILWSKIHYLDANIHYPIKSSDNNFVALGYATDTLRALVLLKFDTSGTILWTKIIQTIGSMHTFTWSPPVLTHDNGFLLSGTFSITGGHDRDFLLIRTNSLGHLLWSKTYSDTNMCEDAYVVETFDRNILIAGKRHIYGIPGDGIQFIKTDSLGNILWANQYFCDSASNHIPRYLVQTPDSGYLLNSSSNGYNGGLGGYNLLLMKTDINGNMDWSKVYKCFWESSYTEILPNHDIISSGIVVETDTLWEPFKAGILKTDSTGNVKWCRRYSTYVHGRMATRTPDNGFLMATAVSTGQSDYLVIKTDSNGVSGCDENELPAPYSIPVFTKTPIQLTTIVPSIIGYDTTYPFSNVQRFVADCIINDIEKHDSNVELQIIPNPTSGNFIVKSPELIDQYDLEIYNSSGMIVLKRLHISGDFYINQNLSPGIYYIKFFSQQTNLVKKFLVVN